MVIRCERCSTMYELDESLLAPTGSEVQCTKCQHVFTAFPPKSAGRTLVGVPAQPPAAAAAPASATRAAEAAPAAAPSAAVASAPVAAAPSHPAPPEPAPDEPAAPEPAARPSRTDGAAGPRPVRTTAPAVYRPQGTGASAGGPQLPTRAPVLKRDTVGTFEARLRWSNRIRWLAPLALGAFVVIVAGLWALLARRGDAGAERTRAEAMALLSLDDSASVEEAVTRLGAVVNKRPKLRAAAADRALALVVRAATTAEDAEALTARVADLREDRERARREQAAGWQELERSASAEAARLEPEIRSREDKTRALSSGARDQLTILQSEAGDTLEVVRAMALLHALTGERDRLRRDLRVAREKGLRDPWIDLAEGWGDARDPERAARERALVKLGALAAARPDLLRGRYLLARDQLSLGRKPEALATTEGVLAANPAHEGAKRLHQELEARASAQAPAPAVPAAATAPVQPGPENPPPRRRKPIAQPVPAASAEAPAAATAPAPSPEPAAQPAAAPASEPAPAPAPAPAAVPQAPAAAPAAPPPAPPPPAPRRRDAAGTTTDAG